MWMDGTKKKWAYIYGTSVNWSKRSLHQHRRYRPCTNALYTLHSSRISVLAYTFSSLFFSVPVQLNALKDLPPKWLVMCRISYIITGSTVALHCCKAHAKINRKMGNSTPCKIVTPKNFTLKLCIRDYVGETTRHANFGFNRYGGGFSPNRRNITTLWLFFDCPVLTFFFSIQKLISSTQGPWI